MMRFLRLSSFLGLIFLTACADPYRGLQEDPSRVSATRFKPAFDKVLYRCVVDGRVLIKKFHLSGLLFFKTMEDGSTRAVFQNEMGFTFFDFEWDGKDSFKVNQVLPQLDKPALIKTLQKDMSLLLMKGLNTGTEQQFRKGAAYYHRFTLEKGYAYYIEESDRLSRIENAGKTRVTTITLKDKESGHSMPESVLFEHHKANFTIRLQKIDTHADE